MSEEKPKFVLVSQDGKRWYNRPKEEQGSFNTNTILILETELAKAKREAFNRTYRPAWIN